MTDQVQTEWRYMMKKYLTILGVIVFIVFLRINFIVAIIAHFTV